MRGEWLGKIIWCKRKSSKLQLFWWINQIKPVTIWSTRLLKAKYNSKTIFKKSARGTGGSFQFWKTSRLIAWLVKKSCNIRIHTKLSQKFPQLRWCIRETSRFWLAAHQMLCKEVAMKQVNNYLKLRWVSIRPNFCRH